MKTLLVLVSFCLSSLCLADSYVVLPIGGGSSTVIGPNGSTTVTPIGGGGYQVATPPRPPGSPAVIVVPVDPDDDNGFRYAGDEDAD